MLYLSVLYSFRHTLVAYGMPSVLWHCWLGGRKGIRLVKNCGGVLAWLCVWSKVQTCTWLSWCHCYSLSLASVKSRLVLPFWYRLTQVVPEKGPLNVRVCGISALMLLVRRQERHPTCLEQGADLHMAQLMPLPLTVSCFSKIQIGSTFLVPAHPIVPDKGPLNG